jgi:UDP-N-acetylglucosamine acyltransferase
MTIHSSAIIEPGAQLGTGVSVGPFCTVGAGVVLGDGCQLGANVHLSGATQIGPGNVFHSGAVIGGVPQDKKYRGEPTELIIGARNTFRECVTANVGTVQDGGVTRLGDDNWIMAYVHIAHDCRVGNQVIMANCTQLAGHVEIGDWVILGGFTGVHQFCKIGAHAMTAISSVVLHDVPPYVMCSGNSASAHGINSEGLKRRGFSPEQIACVRAAYKTLYKNGLTLEQAREALKTQLNGLQDEASKQSLAMLSDFLSHVTRGIVR